MIVSHVALLYRHLHSRTVTSLGRFVSVLTINTPLGSGLSNLFLTSWGQTFPIFIYKLRLQWCIKVNEILHHKPVDRLLLLYWCPPYNSLRIPRSMCGTLLGHTPLPLLAQSFGSVSRVMMQNQTNSV